MTAVLFLYFPGTAVVDEKGVTLSVPLTGIDQEPLITDRERQHLFRKLGSLHLGNIEITLELVSLGNGGDLNDPVCHRTQQSLVPFGENATVHEQEKDTTVFCRGNESGDTIAELGERRIEEIERKLVNDHQIPVTMEGEKVEERSRGCPVYLFNMKSLVR